MGELAPLIQGGITMRDIKSTLQKETCKGILEDIVSACNKERDPSCDVPKCNTSEGLDGLNVLSHTKLADMDPELETCENLRRRKRKQESINIHRVSSDFVLNAQPGSGQEGTENEEAQECQQMPAGKLDKGANGFGHLEACNSPGTSRGRKREREANPLREVGLDISLRTDGSHSLQALGFDISVSSNVSLGIKHASCSLLPDNDKKRSVGARLAIGVVNKGKEERGLEASEAVIGTPVVASGVTNRDICAMSTTKKPDKIDNGQLSNASPGSCGQLEEPGATMPNDCKSRGQGPMRFEEVFSEDQAETQKLSLAVTALQSQLTALHNFAENGSKNCEHCQLVKEELSKLLRTVQVSQAQAVSSEVALVCDAPVGSCRIERAVVETKADEGRKFHVQQEETLEPSFPSTNDAHLDEARELDGPSRCNVTEDMQEVSDEECHLCIELGSSPSEDPDLEELRSGWPEREGGFLPNESTCNSDRLHACLQENEEYSGLMSKQEEVNSEVEKDANGSQDFADMQKVEEAFAKSSKEEECWKSALTRDSCDSYIGGVDNQAEKDGYIDLKCGCTSQKYGDTVGILRLYQNGKLEIQCQCSIGCMKGKPMSPASFERHSGRGASKKWRETIWIVLGDSKVQFSKVKGLDAFVRRYKESGRTTLRNPALAKQSNHRDEFVQCRKCLKRRRFRRKTQEECRLFHHASMNPVWECANYPFESVSCKDDEEREARQANRGCVRTRTCPGCIECVCLGCFTCRFEDCICRLCTEYVANNK